MTPVIPVEGRVRLSAISENKGRERGEGRGGRGRVAACEGRPADPPATRRPVPSPPTRRTEDEMAGLEEFPESACLHRVHRAGLEVHQDGSRDVLARGALATHRRGGGGGGTKGQAGTAANSS